MRRPSLTEAARARLRPVKRSPLWNSLRLRLRSARRFVHALAGVCKVILSAPTQARELGAGAGSAARARFWHTACKKSRRLSAKSSAPPLLTSAPPWRAPLLIRKPTNHPERLAVRVNPGARNGRSRGRLTLSPNRKVKTPVAGCGAVPANTGDRSGRRRGQRLIRPIRKVKTNPPDILAVPANSGDRSGRRRGRLFLSPNRKVKTPIAFGVAVPANPDTRSARRRGHRRVWPNRKIKTLAAGRKTPAPQPDFRQPSVTVSWPKRPLTGRAATTTVPSRQWPQTRACDTGIVAIVVDP